MQLASGAVSPRRCRLPGLCRPSGRDAQTGCTLGLLRLFASIGTSSSSERQYLEAAARRSVSAKREAADTETDRPRRPAGARGPALSEGVACVRVARRAFWGNGTVAPVPACFLTGDSHEERSSEKARHGRIGLILGVWPTPRNRTSRTSKG